MSNHIIYLDELYLKSLTFQSFRRGFHSTKIWKVLSRLQPSESSCVRVIRKASEGEFEFSGGIMKNLHISDKDKLLTGVCAGIGESFGINANIVRGVFLVSLFFGFSGFFIYLILTIILPKGETKPEVIDVDDEEEKTKICRSWKKRMLAGVCGGFSNYFGWDVSLVRIAFAAMTLAGGIGLFLYLFFWFIFPNEE